MIWWVIGGAAAVVTVFVWALCVAASDADDAAERWRDGQE